MSLLAEQLTSLYSLIALSLISPIISVGVADAASSGPVSATASGDGTFDVDAALVVHTGRTRAGPTADLKAVNAVIESRILLL
jgi:hypothetical protein